MALATQSGDCLQWLLCDGTRIGVDIGYDAPVAKPGNIQRESSAIRFTNKGAHAFFPKWSRVAVNFLQYYIGPKSEKAAIRWVNAPGRGEGSVGSYGNDVNWLRLVKRLVQQDDPELLATNNRGKLSSIVPCVETQGVVKCAFSLIPGMHHPGGGGSGSWKRERTQAGCAQCDPGWRDDGYQARELRYTALPNQPILGIHHDPLTVTVELAFWIERKRFDR